jgi:N utilization substance protein B
MGSRRKARILAMQALFSWDMSGCPVDELLDLSWDDDAGKQPATADFARLLIAGAIENITAVDEAIKAHLEHWKLERLAKVDLAILRLGAYSLLFQDGIPASVTIDEAVDIAKEYSGDDSYRFVNGVLDAIHRGHQS